MITLHEAPYAPRDLVYLATFNARERRSIIEAPALRDMIHSANPSEWTGILERWRDNQAAKLGKGFGKCNDKRGYRAQALHDLNSAAGTYAALTDGRRTGLFNAACRVAKYIHQGHLTSQEFRAAFLDAARANGALAKHGQTWADTVLNSAIARAGNDAVPHLAREFRTNGDRP